MADSPDAIQPSPRGSSLAPSDSYRIAVPHRVNTPPSTSNSPLTPDKKYSFQLPPGLRQAHSPSATVPLDLLRQPLAAPPQPRLLPPPPSFWALARRQAPAHLAPLLFLIPMLIGLEFLRAKSQAGTLLIAALLYVAGLIFVWLVSVLDTRRLLCQFTEAMQTEGDTDGWTRSRPSTDVRFEYLCALLRAQEVPSNASAGPLDFLRRDITAAADSPNGHLVADASGQILWCNDALASRLGYSTEELEAENLRVLMPTAYKRMHEGIIKRYDRKTTEKRLVGIRRLLPIVRKSGAALTAHLLVEERFDPNDDTLLFWGAFEFPDGPSPLETLREGLALGLDTMTAVRPLESHQHPTLLVDAKSIILYANTSLCTMLGYDRHDLLGLNIRVLMDPNNASSHHEVVSRYLQRVAASLAAGESACPSSIVGQGRDLHVRHAAGGFLRIWIEIHRVDSASRRVADCHFLTTMLYIQGQGAAVTIRRPPAVAPLRADRSDSQPRSPTGSGRSWRHSFNAAHQPSLTGTGHFHATPSQIIQSFGSQGSGNRIMQSVFRASLKKRRCSVVMFDICGVPSVEGDSGLCCWEAILAILVSTCNACKATLHGPVGDRVTITVNTAIPNAAHCAIAATLMNTLLDTVHAFEVVMPLRLHAAAVTGAATTALFGPQLFLLGESLDLCSCLLRIAMDAQTQRGLIDGTLHQELRYTHTSRLINLVTLRPGDDDQRTVTVHELLAEKVMVDDEWLYQIETHTHRDSHQPWKDCWAHLIALTGSKDVERVRSEIRPPPVPSWAAAFQFLTQYLTENPDDTPGRWLQTLLPQPPQTDAKPSTFQYFGSLPVLIHFHSPLQPSQQQPPPAPPPLVRLEMDSTRSSHSRLPLPPASPGCLSP